MTSDSLQNLLEPGRRGSMLRRKRTDQCLQSLKLESTLFQHALCEEQLHLDKKEFNLGNVIGKGGFSRVRSIIQFPSLKQLENDCHMKVKHSSSFDTMGEVSVDISRSSSGSSYCSTLSKTNPRLYALKEVRRSLSPAMRLAGQIDLAREAIFLKALVHPNIVSLHSNGEIPGSKDNFLVLEKFEYDLSDCIERWSKGKLMNTRKDREFRRLTSEISRIKTKKQYKAHRAVERYQVLADVASALQFLHASSIIHRDIKSANIGITHDGVAKIFDFGLSKEMKEKYRVAGTENYKISIAGTRRYMAPEVFAGKPYNLRADVYSFATLMWEVLMLETPYYGMGSKEHEKFVYTKGKRLGMKRSWPKNIKNVIKMGWNADPMQRPCIAPIRGTLITQLSLAQLESFGYCWKREL